jgi:taurine---2-oxoglutarate transaminase
MTTAIANSPMTGQEIVDLTKKHTLFEWSAQSKVDPIPVARAKGIYFWTPEGKRFIDFNSQLMSVNIGHGDERVIRAITEQASVLAYANPFMATEPRARLGAKLAEITPGDIDTFFFTNGGAEANENAIKIARFFTGRHKIMLSALRVILADGLRSLGFRAWCACSILITVSNVDGSRRRLRWP